MNILIYNPAAERKGGFIIDVGQEQAQIDIAVTLPDAVQCMRSAYYELLLAENITADEGIALLNELQPRTDIHLPSHIIGVTPEWEDYQALSDAFDDQLFPLLIGELKDEMVMDRLMNKLQYLTAVDRQKNGTMNRKEVFENVSFI